MHIDSNCLSTGLRKLPASRCLNVLNNAASMYRNQGSSSWSPRCGLTTKRPRSSFSSILHISANTLSAAADSSDLRSARLTAWRLGFCRSPLGGWHSSPPPKLSCQQSPDFTWVVSKVSASFFNFEKRWAPSSPVHGPINGDSPLLS
jgi:hypothetical protein